GQNNGFSKTLSPSPECQSEALQPPDCATGASLACFVALQTHLDTHLYSPSTTEDSSLPPNFSPLTLSMLTPCS
uniref:Uncharacterized protein n=1 Tax=Geospiza parvula TaxID=87175 RepID=A0A8C3MXL7_GEOPR